MQQVHRHNFRTESNLIMDNLVTDGNEHLEKVKQEISTNCDYWCCDYVFMCYVIKIYWKPKIQKICCQGPGKDHTSMLG